MKARGGREQLSMWFGGDQFKRSGKDLVETSNSEFIELMRSHACEVADRRGSVSTDDLRLYARSLGIKPEHPNAWGAIFRGKAWKVVGRITSKLSSNHSREIRVWGIK